MTSHLALCVDEQLICGQSTTTTFFARSSTNVFFYNVEVEANNFAHFGGASELRVEQEQDVPVFVYLFWCYWIIIRGLAFIDWRELRVSLRPPWKCSADWIRYNFPQTFTAISILEICAAQNQNKFWHQKRKNRKLRMHINSITFGMRIHLPEDRRAKLFDLR